MIHSNVLTDLAVTSPSKIVLLVIDGLGGVPLSSNGPTELETAKTPHLDAFAQRSICGMMDPLAPGITPGSGPAHLALFGYDPFKYSVGRGVLAALGIGFELQHSDVAVRINFASIDEKGIISDRRAGRISTSTNNELCQLLQNVELQKVQFFIRPVKEHRAVAIFRGEGLSGKLLDSDPQRVGLPPKKVVPIAEEERNPETQRTATVVNEFIEQAEGILRDQESVNFILLRGFDQYKPLPSMQERYKLEAAAIAVYPMYRGVARLVGMDVLNTGETFNDELITLRQNLEEHSFFFVHFKKTDAAGEDGDFQRKVQAIEEVDRNLPDLIEVEPDVLIITGDHSTPALLKAHSWHPVPFMLHSKYCRPDSVMQFSERECAHGSLGRFPALHVMPLAMANALKLQKYGA
ncbi:MAG: 2,3-bisphosphoglycerate-independent phosphoglycerate mutase [Gemmatimonadota bacterium]|nr:MAG: 2,3-bisphosphoglycerate-independent phosphoglycerate mutase [Gemmatimonadota bacterium]